MPIDPFSLAQEEARKKFKHATAFRIGRCFAELGFPFSEQYYAVGSNQAEHFKNGYAYGVKAQSGSEVNQRLAFNLLFRDPENDEELRPTGPPHNINGALVITVSNRDGTRKWKHSIQTEEL